MSQPLSAYRPTSSPGTGQNRPPIPPPRTSVTFESLTVPEVAAILGVSKMSTYRLIHSGELTGYRIGRVFRVNRMDLDRYLQAARGPASEKWRKADPSP